VQAQPQPSKKSGHGLPRLGPLVRLCRCCDCAVCPIVGEDPRHSGVAGPPAISPLDTRRRIGLRHWRRPRIAAGAGRREPGTGGQRRHGGTTLRADYGDRCYQLRRGGDPRGGAVRNDPPAIRPGPAAADGGATRGRPCRSWRDRRPDRPCRVHPFRQSCAGGSFGVRPRPAGGGTPRQVRRQRLPGEPQSKREPSQGVGSPPGWVWTMQAWMTCSARARRRAVRRAFSSAASLRVRCRACLTWSPNRRWRGGTATG